MGLRGQFSSRMSGRASSTSDPTLEDLGRAIWFGHFEYPSKEDTNNNNQPKQHIPLLGGFAPVQQQPSTEGNVNQANQTQHEAAEDTTAQLQPGPGLQAGSEIPLAENSLESHEGDGENTSSLTNNKTET